MGTPEIAATILKRLHAENYPISAVIAQPDKPQGRGHKLQSPPVAVFAKEKNLTLYQPTKLRDPEVIEKIKSFEPDYLVVAAYGRILPDEILSIAKKESLNVHASILPLYRGAAPINQVLLDDCAKTGVSIMRVVKELDAGPVFLIKEISITDADDAATLTHKLAELGATALVEALQRIETEGLKPTEQDHSRATHVGKIERSLSLVNWNKPAREIFNQIRALIPWPVSQTKIGDKILKLYSSEVLTQKSSAVPGTLIHISPSGWTVTTASSDLLIKEVQLEGKKRMNAFDLANGLRLEVPAKLGV